MSEIRKRITEGVTRERIATEAKRATRPALTFVAGAVGAALIFAWLLMNLFPSFGHDTTQIRFAVPDDFGVFAGHDDVRFRGVNVGTITKVERRGAQLMLVADLRAEYDVYRDARAEIRPTTPLNDVYLDIVDPGTPKAGKPRADEPLPERQTTTSVTVPEVLDTLQAPQRVGLARTLDNLGNGARDGGQRLRAAFLEAVPFLEAAGDLTQQIALRKEATKRLVHNVALLTSELGDRQTELRRLVATGAATLGTLNSSRGALDGTLREVPGTLTELRRTLAEVDGAIEDVDGGVRSLYPVADRVPAALKAIRDLNRDLRPAVAKLQGPVGDLVPLARILRPTATDLGRVTRSLVPRIPTFDRLGRRLVECEKGVIGFFQWNASLTKFGDKNGPVPRGSLAFGVPDSGAPGVAKRQPEQACTPGVPPSGVPTEEDFR